MEHAHIYTDEAASGAREDRPGLAALRVAAVAGEFRVLLIDDLSRLARNTLLLLSVLEELRFHGVRVVSVADGLDTDDQDATVGIQMRGVFNELQLMDLRKKTLRGQIGQKERGFIVGEATYGYRSVAVGEVRMDKKGRPRPEGYKMTVDPQEAAVILRIFKEFVAGCSESRIVKGLNAEGVPGRRTSKKGWSPATIHRLLRNEKYVGRWIWNRTETRRDPRTGRRRQFPKPESEWFITEDQALRIVPQRLWGSGPAANGVGPQGLARRTREARVSGAAGRKGSALSDRPPVGGDCPVRRAGRRLPRSAARTAGTTGVSARKRGRATTVCWFGGPSSNGSFSPPSGTDWRTPENLDYVFKKLEQEVASASTATPETIRLKEAECDAEQRRVANFIEFVAEGGGGVGLSGRR